MKLCVSRTFFRKVVGECPWFSSASVKGPYTPTLSYDLLDSAFLLDRRVRERAHAMSRGRGVDLEGRAGNGHPHFPTVSHPTWLKRALNERTWLPDRPRMLFLL